LLLTLVLSMVLYRTVEQPFIALGRRLQVTPKQASAIPKGNW
jgi:peptidoglycan/LPS O-acetylase OafA/YrhL